MSHSRKSTLRLKTKTERTASNDRRPEAPRVRTGARARAAARQELAARQAAAPAAPPAAPTPADHDKKAQSHPTARHTQPPPPRTASRRPQPGRPDTGDQGGAIARRTTTFRAFAPCPQGLEPCLADELKALGYDSVRAGRAGCHFEADWAGLLKANLQSRLATRILMQVAHASVHDEDDILALARSTPWEHWFGPRDSLRVDTSAIRSPMRSLQYCNLRAKDGICDRLREREGARPDIDTVRPDARVHLFLEERHATLYLDLSGESLFKRGWRLDKGVAPLRENLAAGMLALSGWRPDAPLLDPFCGSGTILIEAAWMALRVPPGIWRPFGFERLRQHDSRLWRDLKEDARSAILGQLPQPLVGCDLDPAAIEAAHANLRRAHLTPDTLHLSVGDARSLLPPAGNGWIVTNPPYGERLGVEDADTLWTDWASWLKQHYDGWQLNIISDDMSLPGRLRLKPQRRHPLYNGALDCRLFQFELVRHGYRNPPQDA